MFIMVSRENVRYDNEYILFSNIFLKVNTWIDVIDWNDRTWIAGLQTSEKNILFFIDYFE